MKKMRSIIIMFLVLCMIVSVAGCKKEPAESSKPDNTISSNKNNDDSNPSDDASSDDVTSSENSTTLDNTTSEDTVSSGSTSSDVENNKPVSTGKWQQNKFYLSTIWPYAYTGDTAEKRIKSVSLCKEAGLNLVEIPIMPEEDVLNYCDETGIDVIAGTSFRGVGTGNDVIWNENSVKNEIYELYHHKSIIGYAVWDEVGKDKLEKANQLTNLVNKYDPARLAFSCLFPSYGVYNWNAGVTGGNWQDSTYYKYVEDYIKIVDPQVLSFDYYPFILDNSLNINIRDWYRDMGLYRKFSLQYNKPFWYYIGTVDGEENDNVTDSQVRSQLNISLAYGAKTISYFCTPSYLYDKNTFEKTERFDRATELNKQAMAMGNFLFDKTGTEIYHYGLKNQAHYDEIYFLNDIANSDLIEEVVASDGMIISMFKDAEGNDYMMVVTKNLKSKSAIEIKLRGNKSVALLDNTTGKLSTAYTTDLIEHKFIPGEAAIFAIK